MNRDLSGLLHRAVPPPRHSLDLEAVERRARAFTRRRHAMQGAVAALVLLIPVAIWTTVNGPADDLYPPRPAEPATISASPTPSTQPTSGLGFRPATRREGNHVVMPVTFHNGTRAELTFPPDLRLLKEFGMRYNGGLTTGDYFYAEHESGGSPDELYGPAIKSFPGTGPEPVTLRPGPDGEEEDVEVETNYLVFPFGPWNVTIYSEGVSGETEMQEWARLLRGRVTEDGFLTLRGESPLTMQGPTDDPAAGPALFFQDRDDRLIVIRLDTNCKRKSRPDSSAGPGQSDLQVCMRQGVRLTAMGGAKDRPFLRKVANQLKIRNLRE